MPYTRLSSYTRQNVLDMLFDNPIFTQLSTAAKAVHINNAQSRIAALRNSNGNETYQFDSVGNAASVVVTAAANVRYANSGYTLVAIQAAITDAASNNRYIIYFMPGATIGTGWTASAYIDVIWIGGSTVNLDFEAADLTNGIRSLYGMNAIGADFTGCTTPLTLDQFKATLSKYDTTTLWTTGASFGAF